MGKGGRSPSVALWDTRSSYGSSRNHSGINEEIIWVSIGMGITIALLITIALCYILREKCRSSRRPHEYYITA
ncbi:uncharacterized protein [Hetaerina americana]|uniref:uncharacterized protein isoform X1 n=1 Tax=Hetaerina americana TaxID=62018 RepID=UPI003A7F3C85